jgi:hypothetical protein
MTYRNDYGVDEMILGDVSSYEPLHSTLVEETSGVMVAAAFDPAVLTAIRSTNDDNLFTWFIIVNCRKRVRRKWQLYRPLWRDFLRTVSINITFSQINSSLPNVLEVQWPAAWQKFVSNFAFVDIDLMSLVGISCIGDYNYYVSFLVMVCLPVSILVLGALNFHCTKTSMKMRLRRLNQKEKKRCARDKLESSEKLNSNRNLVQVKRVEQSKMSQHLLLHYVNRDIISTAMKLKVQNKRAAPMVEQQLIPPSETVRVIAVCRKHTVPPET